MTNNIDTLKEVIETMKKEKISYLEFNGMKIVMPVATDGAGKELSNEEKAKLKEDLIMHSAG